MEENAFDIIANAVEDYVVKANVESLEDLRLIKKFNNIILKQPDVYFKYKYYKKYDLKETDKIVTKFLYNLNPDYKEYYELRKKDGTIDFNYKHTDGESPYSVYEFGNRFIYLPLNNNIEDSYAIVHELFHDINLDEKEESIARMFYTEGISMLGEVLLEEFLQNKNIKDSKAPINFMLYCLKTKSIDVDFNIKLIESYLINNYIDKGSIIKVLNTYSSSYVEDLSYSIHKIVDTYELSLDEQQTYIVGGLITFYMYDRIKQNRKNIKELFELNEELKNYTFEQVLDYLELNYNNIDLNIDSYQKLEQCYKKYLKSR
mgnify:CR=1 FL=1